MKNTEKPKDEKKEKLLKVLKVAVLILFVLIVLLFLFKSCSIDNDNTDQSTGLVYDPNVVDGGWDDADIDRIVASLNGKVEEGMINISMNTSPVFEDGASEGNLMIVNESINIYPQVVEITRNDTGETIYKSGGIPVGSKIERAKLSKDLPAGHYTCTAMFHNMDPDTGKSLGAAGAIVEITVLN